MNAAVTGGTGFLGRALLELLVPEADTVRVLVRRPEADDSIRAAGAEPVRGDLDDPSSLSGFLQGGEVVFHAAARVAMTGSWSDFHRPIVEGTRGLLDNALPRAPKRFVHISSVAVYPKGHPGPWSADRTPTDPPRENYYGRAKLMAEELDRTECDRAGCPWTNLRPSFLYGPGNRPLLKQIAPLLKGGRLVVIGDGSNLLATLFIEDAARAVLLAGTHPAAVGKIYDVASDDSVTQHELVTANGTAFGLQRAALRLGVGLAYVAATAAEIGSRLLFRTSPFTRFMVTLMRGNQVIDAQRIRDELGWRQQVSFEEGMRRTGEWYRQLVAARDPILPAALVSTE